MSSSGNAQGVCLAAAAADLRERGITFPGAALDCGSEECSPCTRRRTTNNTISADTEIEAQKQERLSQVIEEFSENLEANINPPLGGEGDESSGMIADRVVENGLEELYEDASAKELADIDDIMWSAADREQPQLLSDIDAGCGFAEEDSEMVDVSEAQIGLAEIDNA